MPTIELTEEECNKVYEQLFKSYLYISTFDVMMFCSWCNKKIVSKKTRHAGTCRAGAIMSKFDSACKEYQKDILSE